MFDKHYVRIKNQKLNEYQYYTGGGMTGGYYREVIKRCGDTAVISIERADFHNEDPIMSEYVVNVSLLDEIEKIVVKHRMNHWNNKKFTNMFVSDGESKGYSFTFEESSIRFSSQIYPPIISEKLQEIDVVIKKYKDTPV